MRKRTELLKGFYKKLESLELSLLGEMEMLEGLFCAAVRRLLGSVHEAKL